MQEKEGYLWSKAVGIGLPELHPTRSTEAPREMAQLVQPVTWKREGYLWLKQQNRAIPEEKTTSITFF